MSLRHAVVPYPKLLFCNLDCCSTAWLNNEHISNQPPWKGQTTNSRADKYEQLQWLRNRRTTNWLHGKTSAGYGTFSLLHHNQPEREYGFASPKFDSLEQTNAPRRQHLLRAQNRSVQ